MAEKKKEEHTTFEIGPISEPRMRALFEEYSRDIWVAGGAGREALREELTEQFEILRTSYGLAREFTLEEIRRELVVRQLIDVASIGAAGSTSEDTEPLELETVKTLAVTIRVTYGAGTAGVTVNLYSSPDGVNWDTDVYHTFAPSYTASGTEQKTDLVEACVEFLRIEVVNDDPAVATGAVDVWITKSEGT